MRSVRSPSSSPKSSPSYATSPGTARTPAPLALPLTAVPHRASAISIFSSIRPSPTSTSGPTVRRTWCGRKACASISTVTCPPAARHIAPPQRPHRRARRTAGERREIVLPLQQPRRSLHRRHVQRTPHVPRPVALQRRPHRSRYRCGTGTAVRRACRRGSNACATSFAARTAMSSGRKWFRPLTNSAGVSLDTVSKRGHLAERVDAGVGASGECRARRLRCQLVNRGFQLRLDAGAVLLVLRAAVRGPVVLQQYGDASPGNRGRLRRRPSPYPARSTSSSCAICAPSPRRGPSLMMRV